MAYDHRHIYGLGFQREFTRTKVVFQLGFDLPMKILLGTIITHSFELSDVVASAGRY